MSDTEKQLIESRVARRIVKRKEEILRAGHPCRHYSFVAEGCLRMYVMDAKGASHNIQFAAEGDWIADIGGFHSGKPSQAFIEAVEPSIVFAIEKEDLYHLYRSIPKLDRIFKVIIENKFVELQNRVLQNISSTAHERYQSFVEQYPKLVQRLPNTQIASYLGITPEFLSKVRKDLSSI
ncbi:Crp/Fnr family transcriptional regulator [Imperialibacter roseus]|uniref:Crp/Fnr family transcriptional regulator n=1 Tax=Imperialibacter roseus TaxID=1324217 RepID=A0ABZ0IL62_9BACT|nr:Crp/Fnr family transcriptional regulator [Imperialibacter roseus]WOK04312.1 Crp/Fnr family transcriptional regulator [Imperialibacter roseus]